MTFGEGLNHMQASEWRERWSAKVRTPDDMVGFVDAVRCCTAKPPSGYPSFPNQVDVLGEIAPETTHIWFWKDDLHIEKRVYYTSVFGGRPGFVSFALLPALIATNGIAADEMLYAGMMSPEARQVYLAIEEHGPIPIRDLKRLLGLDAKRAANRVLHELERRFIITKTGITGRTRGTYSYVWDLVERWTPDTLIAADDLGRTAAMSMIREHLVAFGVSPDSSFYSKVLGWAREEERITEAEDER